MSKSPMETRVATTVDFHGDPVTCLKVNDMIHVAMKPISDKLGLEWANQFRKLKRDPVLRSTIVEMTTVAQDKKPRNVITLPLDYLNGWLFKIDAARYKVSDPRRATIIRYQTECYRVLHDYWHKGESINPRAEIPPPKPKPVPKQIQAPLPIAGPLHYWKDFRGVSIHDKLRFGKLCPEFGHVVIPAAIWNCLVENFERWFGGPDLYLGEACRLFAKRTMPAGPAPPEEGSTSAELLATCALLEYIADHIKAAGVDAIKLKVATYNVDKVLLGASKQLRRIAERMPG
jgi:hypothetical protein